MNNNSNQKEELGIVEDFFQEGKKYNEETVRKTEYIPLDCSKIKNLEYIILIIKIFDIKFDKNHKIFNEVKHLTNEK